MEPVPALAADVKLIYSNADDVFSTIRYERDFAVLKTCEVPPVVIVPDLSTSVPCEGVAVTVVGEPDTTLTLS